MRLCPRASTLVFLAFHLSAGAAEEPARFSAERLRPALGRDGILDVETADVPDHLDGDVALWLGYAHNPIAIYRRVDGGLERAGALVGPRAGANLVLALGLFDWLQVGVDVPVVLFQARGALPEDLPLGGLVIGGLGDVRLSPKFQLLRQADYGVDLAFMPTVTAPTSYPRGDYLGEKFFTAAPEVLVSRELFGVRLAGGAGYRARSVSQFAGIVAGHEVFYRAGAALPLATVGMDVPLELELSLGGALGVAPQLGGAPLEVMLGGRWRVSENVRLFAGGGTGIIGGPTVPDFRVVAGISWSPNFADGDRDGINNDVDSCPDQPEDKDGRADLDGCAEDDADKDGIRDDLDKCFDVAEDKDGFEDSDGCPDPDDDLDGVPDLVDRCPRRPGDPAFGGCRPPDQDKDLVPDHLDKCPTIAARGTADGCLPALITDEGHVAPPPRERLEIDDKFQFAFDSDKLLEASGPLCDRIAAQLIERSDVAISIEGHTDDTGYHAYNLKLSLRRAMAVRDALVARGVAVDRFDVAGFGAARPLVDGTSNAARAQNRRVEIIVINLP